MENEELNKDDIKDNDKSQGSELIDEVRKMKEDMISKEEYKKVMDENKQLVEELLNNRNASTGEGKKEVTPADIVERCKGRTDALSGDNSHDAIKALCDNYDDMVTLGMDVSNIDAGVVGKMKEFLTKADGDKEYFKALLDKNVK